MALFYDYLLINNTQIKFLDRHAGLVSAVRKSFTGVLWQKCQIHFKRNILTRVPKRDSKAFKVNVKSIYHFTDMELARAAKDDLINKFIDNKRYEKTCQILDEGFEDAFQYTVVAKGHSKLKSTNVIERLNQEMRRRKKVVRIFPNTDFSYTINRCRPHGYP